MAKSKQIKGRDHWGKGKNGWPCGSIDTSQLEGKGADWDIDKVDYLAPTLQEEFDKVAIKAMGKAHLGVIGEIYEETPVEIVEVEEVDTTNLVSEVEGKLVTNSLLVANKFGKEHRNVMQSIRNLTAENSAVKNMFVETDYVNSRGQVQPMFVMNRDGFSLLVMGFTGSEALKFKIEFIEAFNKMESYIKQQFQVPQSFSEALRLAAAQQEQIELQSKQLALQEAKIELDKPKVLFAETVNTNKRAITMQEFSKILFDKNGIDIGRNDLLYNNLSPLGIYFYLYHYDGKF